MAIDFGLVTFYLIIFFLFSLGLLAVFYFLYRTLLKRYRFFKLWETVLFEITIPKETKGKEEQLADPRELIKIYGGIGEQFLSSLYGIYQKGLKRFLYGQEYFTLEIAAIGSQITFYIGAPLHLASMVEKQIHSYWPQASVVQVKDYNIFSGSSTALAAKLKLFKPNFYPIKTYKYLDSEPLNSLTNALSKLGENEGAAIQILIRPASFRWQKKARRVARGILEGKTKGGLGYRIIFGFLDIIGSLFHGELGGEGSKGALSEPKTITPSQQETVQAIETKASKPGYETIIRVVCASSDTYKAQTTLNNILASFNQFSSPELNGFKPEVATKKSQVLDPFIFRMFTQPDMILNSEELATLFHLPNQLVETPNIKWLLAKKSPPPQNLPQEGLILGESVYRGIKKEVRIKESDLARHVYIIGKSGTGKSTFLQNMIIQDILNNQGLCVIDPHGDLIEDILTYIPKSRAEDVILFDPGDIRRPLGLNLFEFRTPEQKDFLVQECINMLYKLYDPGHTGIIGPRFEHWFRNGALTLMADPHGSSLIEIPRVFTDDQFLKQKLEYVKDPLVRDFWEREMAQTSDFHKSEVLGWFLAKFGAFITNDIMRNILGQVKSAFDLREIMDSKKILLVNLSKGKVGELNSMLLGMIFVAKIQAAAMSRANVPKEERTPFHLYVDEFQNFSTDSFAAILSEARKYSLCLITANQYIAQLEEHIREAVFGNIGTLVCFRVGPADAEFLQKEFAPVFDAQDLLNVETFHVYLRLLIDNMASRPFSMVTIKPWEKYPANKEVAEAIRELSRLKYGRDRAIVEKEIFERFRENEATLGEDFSDIFKDKP